MMEAPQRRFNASYERLKPSGSANVLLDTAHQVAQQMAIVRNLRQQNAKFLDAAERSWIDHILASAKEKISKTAHLTEPIAEKERSRSKWRPDAAWFHQLKQLIRESPADTDDLTCLLIAAQQLNSAIGLLSCCYDRWEWCQSTAHDGYDASSDSFHELSQLMSRRKQSPADRLDQLVRLASVCLHESQPELSGAGADEFCTVQTFTRHRNLPQSEPLERDSRLSLIVVDTVDKWRQNAEDALNLTTQRCSIGADMEPEEFAKATSARGSDYMGDQPVAQHALIINTHGICHSPEAVNPVNRPSSQTKGQDAGLTGPVAIACPSIRDHFQHSARRLTSPVHSAILTRKPVPSGPSRSLPPTNLQSFTPSTALDSQRLLSPSTDKALRDSIDKEVVTDDECAHQDLKKSPKKGRSRHSPSYDGLGPTTAESELGNAASDMLNDLERLRSPSFSVSSMSQHSSTPSNGSLNASSASLATSLALSPPLRPQRVSRGRAWLERQAQQQV